MKEADRRRETGERLRQIRGEASQAEFAKLLDIGRTTLIRYESGERQPDVELLLKLNLLFGVQPIWLLAGLKEETSGIQLNSREKALIENYRGSTEQGKRAVESTASALSQSGKRPV